MGLNPLKHAETSIVLASALNVALRLQRNWQTMDTSQNKVPKSVAYSLVRESIKLDINTCMTSILSLAFYVMLHYLVEFNLLRDL